MPTLPPLPAPRRRSSTRTTAETAGPAWTLQPYSAAAIAVLVASAAVLSATASRDITLQQCRHIPQRSLSPSQPIAHHAGAPTNHAEEVR
jgi:hypothetical protein